LLGKFNAKFAVIPIAEETIREVYLIGASKRKI